jgi:hypothetical protein
MKLHGHVLFQMKTNFNSYKIARVTFPNELNVIKIYIVTVQWFRQIAQFQPTTVAQSNEPKPIGYSQLIFKASIISTI